MSVLWKNRDTCFVLSFLGWTDAKFNLAGCLSGFWLLSSD